MVFGKVIILLEPTKFDKCVLDYYTKVFSHTVEYVNFEG
jgi:hypothetical protein